jgi:hypothetical protein
MAFAAPVVAAAAVCCCSLLLQSAATAGAADITSHHRYLGLRPGTLNVDAEARGCLQRGGPKLEGRFCIGLPCLVEVLLSAS